MAQSEVVGAVSIPGLGMSNAPPEASQEAAMPQSQPPLKLKGRQSKYALRKLAEAQTRALRQSLQENSSTSGDSAALQDRKSRSRFSQDPRQLPSSASGGIPDPSPLYIAQGLGAPSRLPEPRKILIVLDLNGTLLFRPSKRRPSHFVQRPYAQRFLSYCLDTFRVAIWSSARPENVRKMVAQLLTPQQQAQCVVVWARDNFGLSAEDYDARVQVYKRLTRIWADPQVMASHHAAAQGGFWDQSNTVLIDDSLEKGRSEPFSLLPIPEFSGLQNEQHDVLPQVHDYLNLLCYQSDISRYMRTEPFKLDPDYRLLPHSSTSV